MEFCLGTVQFGLDYGVAGRGKPSLENSVAIMQSAYNHGVKYFDTACAYGDAETVVGAFVKALGEERANVITKTPPSLFDNEEDNDYTKNIEKALLQSLEKLGVDRLDCYMIHSAKTVFNQSAIRAMKIAKETGRVKNIGISVYTVEEAMRALEYDEIDYIQLPYNIADTRLDKAGFFEKKGNKKIFARSAFLQGLFLMDINKIPEHLSAVKPMLERFDKLCKENNCSKLETCLSFMNNHKGIDFLVFGVDNQEQLNEILNANLNLDKKITDEARAIFEGVDEYVLMPNLWKKEK